MACRKGMEGQVRAGRQGGLLSTGDTTYTILQIYGNDIPTHGLPQSLQASGQFANLSRNAALFLLMTNCLSYSVSIWALKFLSRCQHSHTLPAGCS